MPISIDGIISLLISVVTTIYDFIKGYIDSIFSFFTFDDPKKTLMLSLLIFLSVFGIIALFSSTPVLGDGVSNVDGNSQINLKGEGGSSQGSGGEGGGTVTSTTIQQVNGTGCRNDNDCLIINEYDYTYQTLCCLPDKYQDYFCQGQCLRYTGLVRDACKLPNACQSDPIERNEYMEYTLDKSCVNKNLKDENGNFIPMNARDAYCQTRTGNIYYNSRCCDDKNSIGYGMCTKDVADADCNDLNDVLTEKEVTIKLVEAYDL